MTFWSFDVLIILKILLMFWPFDVLIFDVLTLSCLNIVRLATEPVTSTDVTRQVFKPDLEQCKIIWPPQMNLGLGRRLGFFKTYSNFLAFFLFKWGIGLRVGFDGIVRFDSFFGEGLETSFLPLEQKKVREEEVLKFAFCSRY